MSNNSSNIPDFTKPQKNISELIKQYKHELAKISPKTGRSYWQEICIYQKLEESVIKDNFIFFKSNFPIIFRNQRNLSENFIDWCMTKHEKLNNVINMFSWQAVSTYQPVSEVFIKKWEKYIYFNCLDLNEHFQYRNYSEEFFERHSKYFDLEKVNKERSFSKPFCLKYNLDSRWSK